MVIRNVVAELVSVRITLLSKVKDSAENHALCAELVEIVIPNLLWDWSLYGFMILDVLSYALDLPEIPMNYRIALASHWVC